MCYYILKLMVPGPHELPFQYFCEVAAVHMCMQFDFCTVLLFFMLRIPPGKYFPLVKFILLLIWTLAGSLQVQGDWDFQPLWYLRLRCSALCMLPQCSTQSSVCEQCPLHSVLYWLLLSPLHLPPVASQSLQALCPAFVWLRWQLPFYVIIVQWHKVSPSSV